MSKCFVKEAEVSGIFLLKQYLKICESKTNNIYEERYANHRPLWYDFHFAQYFLKNPFSTFFNGLGMAFPAA